jgi:hypothetical protein
VMVFNVRDEGAGGWRVLARRGQSSEVVAQLLDTDAPRMNAPFPG